MFATQCLASSQTWAAQNTVPHSLLLQDLRQGPFHGRERPGPGCSLILLVLPCLGTSASSMVKGRRQWHPAEQDGMADILAFWQPSKLGQSGQSALLWLFVLVKCRKVGLGSALGERDTHCSWIHSQASVLLGVGFLMEAFFAVSH